MHEHAAHPGGCNFWILIHQIGSGASVEILRCSVKVLPVEVASSLLTKSDKLRNAEVHGANSLVDVVVLVHESHDEAI
jgi:hypothetical protein